jgi:glycosyltransferase involved in cell wall biosynthesis
LAKIWYISKYASVPPAQAGNRGYRLLEGFRAKGHQIRLICSSSNHLEEPREEKSPGFSGSEILRIGAPRYQRGESLARLLSWVIFDFRVAILSVPDTDRPDFIIASSPSLLTPISAYLLAKRTGARLVVEVRDIWPLTGTEEYGYSPRHPLVLFARFIEKFAYENSDGIVGLMPRLNLHVKTVTRKSSPVTAIGLGVDSEIPLPAPLPSSRKSGEPLVVGYAGTLGKSNAMEAFFQAAELLQHNDSFVFEVAGSGDLADHFSKRFASLPNLQMHGQVPRIDAFNFMRRCHVLYFSSPVTKIGQFGQSLNKIVDYMSTGRPILGSYSGFLTMLNEADAGWVIPADDPVGLVRSLKLIEKESVSSLNRKGRNGFEWISKHRSYSRLASDYLDFLFSLAAGSNGPASATTQKSR